MNHWTKYTLTGLGLVGAGIASSLAIGANRWKHKTLELVGKLKEAASKTKPKTVSFKYFEQLPDPVARYFRFALKEGQSIVKTTKIKHTGKFNLNDKWIPFESTQHFSSNPPAFVWDADMRMNSLANVRIRDSYLDGKGSMHGEILSLVTIVDAHDKPRINEAALQRYLAEAVWFPTALLPSENLKWSAIDENRALATLTDSGTTVSLEFRFNEQGENTGVFTPNRFREVNGEYVPTPWEARVWNYRERGGIMIPSEGEVEWHLPEGKLPYWKGSINDAEYDFGS